ncbi:MAG TPA: fumarylacetoacetate hydrolase family protein [Bryobacteraceae bacterium]|nr:fumarylacetoacetate hydrolase family protein [Bryobacteraceae bacterium]
MKLITFTRAGGAPEPGVLMDDRVVSVRAAGFHDVIAVLAAGAEGRDAVEGYAGDAPDGAVARLSAVTLLAPIPRPPKFICVGLNYRDHAAEVKADIPSVPTIFNKFPSVVIGPRAPIVLPKNSEKPDYEAEFAFVIGKGGRHIAGGDWRDHVAGYTIVNDVSARDFQMATTQWLMGKTFDTFAPMGPWIVTSDEIEDPHNLGISLEINGEQMQNSNTRELIFRIPELVQFISSVVTLEPGDVVATGTPAGVGAGRKPPRWLRPGDEITVRISGIGELSNPVTAEQ